MTNDRHYNIKSLKKIDKDLARTYTNTKYYGGSLKSFFKKVGNFAKKVLNAPAKIASKIYPWMKKGIDKLDSNSTVKNLLTSVPIVGPAIPAAIHGLKDITDNVDVLIKNIQEKNPGASVQQIKEIIRKITGTFNDVKDRIPEEDKKIIKNNVDKVLKHLPDLIKKEGVAKVDKAAGYLPFLDGSTMKTEEREGKGGRVLAPKIRFMKPLIINKHKDVFSKLPAYDAKAVGEVGGALFSAKTNPKKGKECGETQALRGGTDEITTPAAKVGSGRVALAGEKKEGCGRVALAGEKKEKESGRLISDSKAGRMRCRNYRGKRRCACKRSFACKSNGRENNAASRIPDRYAGTVHGADDSGRRDQRSNRNCF